MRCSFTLATQFIHFRHANAAALDAAHNTGLDLIHQSE
jgi:hypothetical protein